MTPTEIERPKQIPDQLQELIGTLICQALTGLVWGLADEAPCHLLPLASRRPGIGPSRTRSQIRATALRLRPESAIPHLLRAQHEQGQRQHDD